MLPLCTNWQLFFLGCERFFWSSRTTRWTGKKKRHYNHNLWITNLCRTSIIRRSNGQNWCLCEAACETRDTTVTLQYILHISTVYSLANKYENKHNRHNLSELFNHKFTENRHCIIIRNKHYQRTETRNTWDDLIWIRRENWRELLTNREYHTSARRYEFYFRVVKTIFYERAQRVKYCFEHEKIKFISSSHRAIFFLLYRHIYRSPFFTDCLH